MESKHNDVIWAGAIVAGLAGIPGVFFPLVDVVAVGRAWKEIVTEIARREGRELDKATVLKFIQTLLKGVALYVAGSKIFTSVVAYLVPLVGTTAAVGANAALNTLYTLRFGRQVARILGSPDFSTEDLLDSVKDMQGLIFKKPTNAELSEASDVLHEVRQTGGTSLVKPELFKQFERAGRE